MIRNACIRKGFGFLAMTTTNQQFPILSDKDLTKLGEKYVYSYWKRVDSDHSAVRFCTGWGTKEDDVMALIADIEKL